MPPTNMDAGLHKSYIPTHTDRCAPTDMITSDGPKPAQQRTLIRFADRLDRTSTVFYNADGRIAGSTHTAGQMRLEIPRDKILNGLSGQRATTPVLEAAAQAEKNRFCLIYQEGALHLWPEMRAAGSDEFHRVAETLNPFVGKTVEECKSYFRNASRQDGAARWVEIPAKGEDAQGHVWLNPHTGRKAFIDKGGDYASGHEPPHIDMHYAKPYQTMKREVYAPDGKTVTKVKEMKLTKKKFPLDPTRPEWKKYIHSNQEKYKTHERLMGRNPDPEARTVAPSMQKGGVEFSLAPLNDLQILPEMTIFHRLGTNSLLYTKEEVHQIIRELFVGIYICDEFPSVSMDPSADSSVDLSIPACYQRTLVADVLKNIDAFGKGILLGMLMPPGGRWLLGDDWRDVFGVTEKDKAKDVKRKLMNTNYEDMISVFRRYGGTNLLDESTPESAELKKTAVELDRVRAKGGIDDMNFTFVPNVTSVEQGDGAETKFVVPNVELAVGGAIRYTEAYQGNSAYQREADSAHRLHAEAIKKNMLSMPIIARDIELLKVIGFYVHLLTTLKQKNLCPDLNKIPAPYIVYEEEQKMPPFLKPKCALGSDWTLYGGSHVDLTVDPVTKLSVRNLQLTERANSSETDSDEESSYDPDCEDLLQVELSVGTLT